MSMIKHHAFEFTAYWITSGLQIYPVDPLRLVQRCEGIPFVEFEQLVVELLNVIGDRPQGTKLFERTLRHVSAVHD